MRPGDFSPGNLQRHAIHWLGVGQASMRPGDFSPGNCQRRLQHLFQVGDASMRPGDFSPGNGDENVSGTAAAVTNMLQ